jgi:hypothetical protein
MVLTNPEYQALADLMIHLSKFQNITNKLQVQGCSPLTICEVFDAKKEHEYFVMDYYLAPTSDIVNNLDFESGLVKELARNHLSLTSSEKQALSNLLKISSTLPLKVIRISPPHHGYVEELQERKCCRLSDEQD